jgi:hypothetical protein|tara:strand:- start:491 stop:772 length:282 start_codon:yes stop_codon:yes gene_type:complete
MKTYKVKVKKLQTAMAIYNVKADSTLDAYHKFIDTINPDVDWEDDYDIVDDVQLGIAEIISAKEMQKQCKKEGVYIGTVTKPFILADVLNEEN